MADSVIAKINAHIIQAKREAQAALEVNSAPFYNWKKADEAIRKLRVNLTSGNEGMVQLDNELHRSHRRSLKIPATCLAVIRVLWRRRTKRKNSLREGGRLSKMSPRQSPGKVRRSRGSMAAMPTPGPSRSRRMLKRFHSFANVATFRDNPAKGPPGRSPTLRAASQLPIPFTTQQGAFISRLHIVMVKMTNDNEYWILKPARGNVERGAMGRHAKAFGTLMPLRHTKCSTGNNNA
jgi:hypothetical protein